MNLHSTIYMKKCQLAPPPNVFTQNHKCMKVYLSKMVLHHMLANLRLVTFTQMLPV